MNRISKGIVAGVIALTPFLGQYVKETASHDRSAAHAEASKEQTPGILSLLNEGSLELICAPRDLPAPAGFYLDWPESLEKGLEHSTSISFEDSSDDSAAVYALFNRSRLGFRKDDNSPVNKTVCYPAVPGSNSITITYTHKGTQKQEQVPGKRQDPGKRIEQVKEWNRQNKIAMNEYFQASARQEAQDVLAQLNTAKLCTAVMPRDYTGMNWAESEGLYSSKLKYAEAILSVLHERRMELKNPTVLHLDLNGDNALKFRTADNKVVPYQCKPAEMGETMRNKAKAAVQNQYEAVIATYPRK